MRLYTRRTRHGLERETSAVQNNTIRINYIKVKIDNIQENSKCRLCGDRGEMVNHIISKWRNLVQKMYSIRHDWVEKVILLESCKRLKFDHTAKWYMYKPESVLENEMHKIVCDFVIQTNHLILARRPDLVLIKKKKRSCHLVDFSRPKIKVSENRDKYLDLARELKKLWNIKVTADQRVNRKEREKIYKYLDLARELKKLWNIKVTADQRVNTKERENIDKYLDLARELKKLWNMKVTADQSVNRKESENIDKYLDLARELKKLWNMKLMVIQIVDGSLGINQNLSKKIRHKNSLRFLDRSRLSNPN